jgi:cytidine deaminase
MTDASEIAAELRALLPRAHAPYSGVQVACAVEGADGTTHLGVNVENAAYPQGLCAEASAISAAVTQGTTKLTRVYVAASLPGLVWSGRAAGAGRRSSSSPPRAARWWRWAQTAK